MNDVAFLVSEDLHFDMLGILEIFLDEYIIYTKSLGSFGSGGSELREQFLFGTYYSHTSSTAACSSLQDDGIAAHCSEFSGLLFGLDGFFNSGNRRNSYGLSHKLGLDLVSEIVHHLSGRSDEFDACLFTGSCEIHVL